MACGGVGCPPEKGKKGAQIRLNILMDAGLPVPSNLVPLASH